jgi:hypothetical protein
MKSLDRLWFFVPVALLLAALLPLPYGYYQFLRIAIAIAAGFIAYSAFGDGKQGWAVTFGAICVLFNPIVPIYLSKGIWAPIDIVGALVFLAGWRMIKGKAERE